jgi:16S rRNA (cytosine967-C5)-methyltransferase
MKAKTPRDLALGALIRLARDSGFSSNVLDRLFRANRSLDDRDRAFVSQLVQGVIRWRLRLDWIIGGAAHFPLPKIDPRVLDILRLALYQIFFLDRVPESAAVNEAVNQAKAVHAGHVVSFVNGLLRNICRHKDRIAFPDRRKDPVRYLSVYYSYPSWIVEKWVRELGEEEAEALLDAGNRTPPLTGRVNGLKATRSELIRRLEGEGLKAKPTLFSPLGVVIEGLRGRVDQLQAFREGLFQVQDEAAQITSFLLAPSPRSTVLDVCAGHGGKTSHLAELMGNQGNVVALDTNRSRLVTLTENSKRLGIGIVHPAVADAAKDASALFRSSFDRIMVDAPCSGLGVLSRHPDGKWNRSIEDVKRLAGLQSSILNQTAKALKKGGRMLYVTCTVSREENEGVVEAFLRSNRDFVLANLRDQALDWTLDLIDERGFFRALPHRHGTDGFFAALLRGSTTEGRV